MPNANLSVGYVASSLTLNTSLKTYLVYSLPISRTMEPLSWWEYVSLLLVDMPTTSLQNISFGSGMGRVRMRVFNITAQRARHRVFSVKLFPRRLPFFAVAVSANGKRIFKDFDLYPFAALIGQSYWTMATVTLPKIPSKLVDTAFPPGEPRPSWLQNKRTKRKEKPFPAPSKTPPCSKEARGKKRSNRKHRRVYGYPSREDLAKDHDSDSAFLAKKLEDMRRLEEMNRQRYKQLKRAAKAGDLALTRDGVFESKPCSSCPANTYHKVASLTEFRDPCPGSHMAQHSQNNKRGKKAHEEKVRVSYTCMPLCCFALFLKV